MEGWRDQQGCDRSIPIARLAHRRRGQFPGVAAAVALELLPEPLQELDVDVGHEHGADVRAHVPAQRVGPFGLGVVGDVKVVEPDVEELVDGAARGRRLELGSGADELGELVQRVGA